VQSDWPDANGFERDFYVLLLTASQNAGFEPEWLLALMASVSGLDPRAVRGETQGLSQLVPPALRNLGVRIDGFSELPAHEQLQTVLRAIDEWRVRCHLSRWESRAQMYLCSLLPVLLPVGCVPTYVVVDGQRAPEVYAANPQLDPEQPNPVTELELEATIAEAIRGERYQVALDSLAKVRS